MIVRINKSGDFKVFSLMALTSMFNAVAIRFAFFGFMSTRTVLYIIQMGSKMYFATMGNNVIFLLFLVVAIDCLEVTDFLLGL